MISVSNNSKWTNFFQAIEDHGFLDFECEIKFINEKSCYPFNLDAGVAYTRTHTKDGSCQGPIKFSDIEYLFIPSYKKIVRMNRTEKLTSKFVKNDLEAIINLMHSLGLYEYEHNEKGLIIYGYKSSNT